MFKDTMLNIITIFAWILSILKNKYFLMASTILFTATIWDLKKERHHYQHSPPDPSQPLPPSGSRIQYFKKAAVSSDAGACARIGRDILKKNGSAIDAAIAAMICNSVINLQSAGFGGGFLMIIFKKSEEKVYCLNARERAPLRASEDLYRYSQGATKNGSLAIGVPGEIKGYLIAHQRFGKLPWKDLVQPVIELCDNGYIMSKHQYWSILKKYLDEDNNFRNWFYDNEGNIKGPGSKIYPKKLCDFLRMLSQRGPEDFYTGQISKMFLEDIKDIDGIIREDDLTQFRAEWLEPIHVTLNNGDHFYSFPPPGCGAITALILNVLDGYNFTRRNLYESDIAITYHRIIEAFKFAMSQRATLGDPNFVDIEQIVKQITSKQFASNIRLKIKSSKAYSSSNYYGAQYFVNQDHGTSHLSILDGNGDAVAATSTINIYFGAGLSSNRTGIVLNSAMDDFAYSDITNYFGLPVSEANKMKPGKRPLSSMSPSILVDKNGNVKTVIGAAGGPKIITAIALTLARVLWFGDNLKDAIDAARVHHQMFPMEVHYEYGLLKNVVNSLKSMGHKLVRKTESIVYALHKDESNIMGIVDQRKDGGGVYGI